VFTTDDIKLILNEIKDNLYKREVLEILILSPMNKNRLIAQDFYDIYYPKCNQDIKSCDQKDLHHAYSL
jgi:hypothetical protein